jgi:F0F1-type ATP synthase membrane subunit c/vacuolar-type H+-ATPase subunit K
MKGPYFFLIVFFVLIAIPCIGVGILGSRMINELGRYPSKMPAIQKRIFLKLLGIEVLSLGLLAAAYWTFVN